MEYYAFHVCDAILIGPFDARQLKQMRIQMESCNGKEKHGFFLNIEFCDRWPADPLKTVFKEEGKQTELHIKIIPASLLDNISEEHNAVVSQFFALLNIAKQWRENKKLWEEVHPFIPPNFSDCRKVMAVLDDCHCMADTIREHCFSHLQSSKAKTIKSSPKGKTFAEKLQDTIQAHPDLDLQKVSAKVLAQLVRCSETTIKNTSWWKENMEKRKKPEINRWKDANQIPDRRDIQSEFDKVDSRLDS